MIYINVVFMQLKKHKGNQIDAIIQNCNQNIPQLEQSSIAICL